MELLQLGEGLRRQARIEPHRSLSFRDCFEIVSPKMEPSFHGILLRLASPFTIRTRPDATQSGTKEKVTLSHVIFFSLQSSNCFYWGICLEGGP